MHRIYIWAALLVCLLAGKNIWGAEKPWLVYMQPTVPTRVEHNGEMLYIELVRQSVLLCAREEFGALTRDGNCSEPIPADLSAYAGILKVQVTTSLPNPGTIESEITTISPDGKREVVKDSLIFGDVPDMTHGHEKMIGWYEEFSRSKATSLFKNIGLPMRKPAAAPGQNQIASLNQRLGEMCCFAQYDVLRQAHPLLLAQGDSEELLTIVTRAYAHLGQFCRSTLDGSSKVYVARSLLYGQRLVGKHKSSPAALQARAYAKAITGMHAGAMTDLEEATKLAAAEPPAWVQAADLLCHYQRRALLEMADKDPAMARIASYFAFMTVEYESSPPLVIETAKKVLERNPHALRIFDAACEKSGISYLHAFTEMGFPLVVQMLQEEWPSIEAQAPESVRSVREQAKQSPNQVKAVADIARALVTCDVPAEPSWSTLGNLIEQADYLVVFRRAYFMAMQWSVPTSGYLAEMAPLYEHHPLKDYLLSMGDQYRGNRQIRAAFLSKLNVLQTFPLMLHIGRDSIGAEYGGNMIGTTLCNRFSGQIDRVAYEWDMMLMGLRGSDIPQNQMVMRAYAPLLNTVSPYDPVAAAGMIDQNWNQAQLQVEQWKAQLKDSPVFLNAMGRHYAGMNQWLEAAKYYEQQIAIAPDAEAYRALADCYANAKQPENGIAALERSLQQEDYGLDHATTLLKLSGYYKNIGNHAKGIACAEQAAGSWAAWAMLGAAGYHEEVGNWERANLWYSRVAERYGRYGEWYAFCTRTGYGDREALTRAMAEKLKLPLDPHDRDAQAMAICYFIQEHQEARATPILRGMAQQTHEPWAALLLAVSKDPQISRDDRMMALRECAVPPEDPVTARPSIVRPYLNDLAGMMSEAMSGQAPLDLAALRELWKTAPVSEQPNVLYPAAMYLLQVNLEKDGIVLLEECVANPTFQKVTWKLALNELRERKLAPAKLPRPTTAQAALPATRSATVGSIP